MATVFVAYDETGDGEVFRGVFTTREKAEAFVATQRGQQDFLDYREVMPDDPEWIPPPVPSPPPTPEVIAAREARDRAETAEAMRRWADDMRRDEELARANDEWTRAHMPTPPGP